MLAGHAAHPDRRRDLLPHPLGAAGLVAALTRTTTIGHHYFYRAGTQVAGG